MVLASSLRCGFWCDLGIDFTVSHNGSPLRAFLQSMTLPHISQCKPWCKHPWPCSACLVPDTILTPLWNLMSIVFIGCISSQQSGLPNFNHNGPINSAYSFTGSLYLTEKIFSMLFQRPTTGLPQQPYSFIWILLLLLQNTQQRSLREGRFTSIKSLRGQSFMAGKAWYQVWLYLW